MPTEATALQTPLLDWYRRVARDLPWRRDPQPWKVWVSEIMCQQTRVESVIPYFERFIARFPTPSALAQAPIEDAVDLWAGLGYYSRVRNLHKAATEVLTTHSGQVPSDPAAFGALTGVGPYTQGAVQSIAFGHRVAVVDGNVERVLCRLDRFEADPRNAAGKRWVWGRAAQFADHPQPGDINQALMELGATVCTPRSPDCANCPLAPGCQGRHLKAVEALPFKKARKARPTVAWVAALLTDANGAVFLTRRPDTGLLAGLWTLPMAEGTDPRALEILGLTPEPAPCAQVKHGFTHRLWQIAAHRCTGQPQKEWVAFSTDQMAQIALGGPTLKALRAAGLKLPRRRGAG